VKPNTVPQFAPSSPRSTQAPRVFRQTLIGARLRWLAGLLKACYGEVTGNARMEVEGTVSKLLGRIDVDNLKSGRLPEAAAAPAAPPTPYDITLHERAARQLERAALHHRQALRWYRAGNSEQARYHACVAQGFCMDAGEIASELGRRLWRSMEGQR
jgi:hypothetical protein